MLLRKTSYIVVEHKAICYVSALVIWLFCCFNFYIMTLLSVLGLHLCSLKFLTGGPLELKVGPSSCSCLVSFP